MGRELRVSPLRRYAAPVEMTGVGWVEVQGEDKSVMRRFRAAHGMTAVGGREAGPFRMTSKRTGKGRSRFMTSKRTGKGRSRFMTSKRTGKGRRRFPSGMTKKGGDDKRG